MTLREAYGIISEEDGLAVLHVDHICGEPQAHDSFHCSLSGSEQYTDEDAAQDRPDALRARIAA